jgi:hypothetical protein
MVLVRALLAVGKFLLASLAAAVVLILATSGAVRLGFHPHHLWYSTLAAVAAFAVSQFVVARSRPLRLHLSVSTSILSAVVLLVGIPIAFTEHHRSRHPSIPRVNGSLGPLDIVLVSPAEPSGSHGVAPPAQPSPVAPFSARVARARFTLATYRRGDELRLVAVRLTRAAAVSVLTSPPVARAVRTSIEWRRGAERVAVLDVDADPTRRPGLEPRRDELMSRRAWQPAIASLSRQRARVFVLLRHTPPGRVGAWRAVARAARGDAVSLDSLASETLPDAAAQLVTQTSMTRYYASLAEEHRPQLFFSRGEPFKAPTDVDEMFARGDVSMCRSGLRDEDCIAVADATRLDPSFDRLHLKPSRSADRPAASAETNTYYYAVHRRRSTLYLDYWWYLPSNPQPVLPTVLCGPGFNLPGITCHEHESDWEGVVVVLDPSKGPDPVEVRYAQHKGVTTYRWRDLVSRWHARARGQRPLVFVASKSHASYPLPCSSGCRQTGSFMPDGAHDGFAEWAGNDDDNCQAACLQPLPRTYDGRPATWNAYPGRWGNQECILDGAACNRAEGPQSPSLQDRYRHPEHAGTRRRP